MLCEPCLGDNPYLRMVERPLFFGRTILTFLSLFRRRKYTARNVKYVLVLTQFSAGAQDQSSAFVERRFACHVPS